MGNLATAEHDRDLDLVPFTEELTDLAGLGVEVTAADLRAVLHLLDDDCLRLLPGLLVPLALLVHPLGVVEDLAHRRTGHRRDLDQVEFELSGQLEGFGQRLDAELRPVGTYQTYLASANPLVATRLVSGGRGYPASLLSSLVVRGKAPQTTAPEIRARWRGDRPRRIVADGSVGAGPWGRAPLFVKL